MRVEPNSAPGVGTRRMRIAQSYIFLLFTLLTQNRMGRHIVLSRGWLASNPRRCIEEEAQICLTIFRVLFFWLFDSVFKVFQNSILPLYSCSACGGVAVIFDPTSYSLTLTHLQDSSRVQIFVSVF